MEIEERKELVMQAIADMKSTLVGQTFNDAETMARAWFVQGGNTHGNWDILYPEIKVALTKLAELAMYEIRTGKILTE
jgi:hypothetical protein